MWNLDHSDGDFMTPFQGHESYLLSLLSENNKCDSISESPTMVHKHMGAPLNGLIKM